MVYIDDLDAYIHWLPVTKIQFEQFICSQPSSQFSESWYNELLQLNPRITPSGVRDNNYWQALLTGVLPREAQNFARWSGDGYALPTLEEWFTAYKALKAEAPELESIADLFGREHKRFSERARTLLTRMDSASAKACKDADYERTLADQMLMRLGVMEWIEVGDQRIQWGGMGETNSRLHGNLFTPDHGQASKPNNPETTRLHYYGFRLIWRAG
jgi:hypothetical protein